MGTFRLGFSMLVAETAALSIPMKAQSAIDAERDAAWKSDFPVTFQASLNSEGSNQNQPTVAIPRIGISARPKVQVSNRPTNLGPTMFTTVSSQITAMVPTVLPGRWPIQGMNAAR